MLKYINIAVIILVLSSPVLIFPAQGQADQKNSDDDTVIVNGTGYPPIMAQSAAQAHLMARRAAVIDAYRNALTAKGIRDYDENNIYIDLQGHIRGMTVISEDYLEDGGIRVLARVSIKDVSVSSGGVSDKPKSAGRGPLSVSVEEWYKIIRKLVKIEQ
jgi:hypothetical protein